MKIFFFLPLLLCLVGAAFGQKLKSAKADKYYAAYQFAAAAQAYEKVLQLEPGNTNVMVKLVQCYTRLENRNKANYWLDKALKTSPTEVKYDKQLAALLARSAIYPEAAQLYGKTAADNDAESSKWQQAYQNLPAFYEDSLLYTIRKVAFNSTFSDFSPVFYKKGVVFSSSRSHKGQVNLIQKNFASFIDLFYAATDAAAPVPFSAELNSMYHEGPLSFNPTQDTIYFTRTNTQQKTGLKYENQHTLQIYAAVLEDQKWQKIQALPFNQKNYSVGHPALSNHNTLYFISDMPGGLGGTDLYKTSRVGGAWQTPVNLGPEINTSGDEMFPFVVENGTLYFASNGHPGLGGLDIFYAAPTEAGFGPVKTMGYPINTPGDDFGLIIKNDAGYYSSNYKSEHDDIYSFRITRQKPVVLVVVDKEGKPVTDVQLEISAAAMPNKSRQLATTPAVLTWTYNELEKLTLTKKGYTPGTVSFSKTDFLKYQVHDTIRVTVPQIGNRSVPVVLLDESGQAVAGGKVEVTDSSTGAKKLYAAEEQLFTLVALAPGKSYQLRGIKSGFQDAVRAISASEIEQLKTGAPVDMTLKAKELFTVTKVGATIELEIEYDLNKTTIRPDRRKFWISW